MHARRFRTAWETCVLVAAAAACSAGDMHGGSRTTGVTPSPRATHAGAGQIGSTDNAQVPAQTGAVTGGAGTSGTGMKLIGGADAGTFMPRADLDPNVNFDWQETSPGGGNACQAGTYTGTFECQIVYDTSMPDAGAVTVTGPITLHFEKSADGEFLELADAKLEGVGMDVFGFTADLSGKLDCATLQFMSQAQNGQYGLGLPIGIPLGIVEGTLEGALDGQSHELSGTWSLTADGGITCIGPWHGSYTP